MEHIHLLPKALTDGYSHWKTNGFATQAPLFKELVDQGQSPLAMVVSCSDSRVDIPSIFNTAPGVIFAHRNVANFVHPYSDTAVPNAAGAAMEYAITALKIPHLIVVGHSQCGGVAGCHAMCSGSAPELEQPNNLVGRWIDGLRPAFARLENSEDEQERLKEFEQQSVLLSLENIKTYPFAAEALKAGTLKLHGLWIDIAAGQLWEFNPEKEAFVIV